MTAKEFFNSVLDIDILISNKLEQKERIKALITRVTPTMHEETSGGSIDNHKLENGVEKLMRLEAEIDRYVDELVDREELARKIISSLENNRHKIVLEDRYLLRKTFEKIATELGCSYQNVCKIHGYALSKADKILKRMELVDKS